MAPNRNDLMAKKMLGGVPSEYERRPRLGRRQFLRAGAVVGLSVASVGPWSAGRTFALDADEETEAPDMQLGADELIVQPVLMYGFPTPGRSPTRQRRSESPSRRFPPSARVFLPRSFTSQSLIRP
jgi:hypothetical protein